MMTTKKEAQPAPEGRVKRVRVGASDKMAVYGKDSNYHYRIVNDRDGTGQRLQEFLNAGYEFVDKGVETNTGRVDQPADQGANKTFAVGKGTTAYLMRIPIEFYQEDQKEKQRIVDAQEETLFNGPEGSDYGGVQTKKDTHR